MWLHSLEYFLILYLLLRKSGKELRDDVNFYVIIQLVFSSTFNSMNHRPPTAFCSLVMGGWCSSYVLSRPFFFTVSWLCHSTISALHSPSYVLAITTIALTVWCVMSEHKKITNSTVQTFLMSIISIKSDFYVLSLYKNYYYQIMPTVTNFPQVNNQAQAWVLCSLELKMLVTPRPGLYDTDAYSIF